MLHDFYIMSFNRPNFSSAKNFIEHYSKFINFVLVIHKEQIDDYTEGSLSYLRDKGIDVEILFYDDNFLKEHHIKFYQGTEKNTNIGCVKEREFIRLDALKRNKKFYWLADDDIIRCIYPIKFNCKLGRLIEADTRAKSEQVHRYMESMEHTIERHSDLIDAIGLLDSRVVLDRGRHFNVKARKHYMPIAGNNYLINRVFQFGLYAAERAWKGLLNEDLIRYLSALSDGKLQLNSIDFCLRFEGTNKSKGGMHNFAYDRESTQKDLFFSTVKKTREAMLAFPDIVKPIKYLGRTHHNYSTVLNKPIVKEAIAKLRKASMNNT